MNGNVTFGHFVKYALALSVGAAIAYIELIYVVPYIVFIMMLSIGKDIQNYTLIDSMYQMKKGRKSNYSRKETLNSRLIKTTEIEEQEKELIYIKELRETVQETIKIKAWGYGAILSIVLFAAFFTLGGFEWIQSVDYVGGSNFVNIDSLK